MGLQAWVTSYLVVYITSFLGEDSPQYMYLDIHESDTRDAEHNEGQLMNCFEVHGLHEEYLKENWTAIATNGAKCNAW